MPRDAVSGLFWLAVSIFAAAHGLSLQLGSLNRPGPGFFPFWGGVVLALLSAVLIVSSFRRAAATSRVRPESSKPLVVVGALLAYLLLVESLGFVAASSPPPKGYEHSRDRVTVALSGDTVDQVAAVRKESGERAPASQPTR